MQKFALLFLAASISFSGLLAPVQGQEIVNRETNGERLARGLNPLPPTKRDNHGTSNLLFFSTAFLTKRPCEQIRGLSLRPNGMVLASVP